MNVFLRLYDLYGRLVGYLATIAGISTFCMMWLVDANVLGRKIFNQPVISSVEISQALLVACVFLAMPFAQARGAHLRVTLITGLAPRRLGEMLFGISALAGCALFGVLTYSSYHFALRAWIIGEEVWGASLRFPLWPVKGIIPLGAALLSGQFLLDALRVLLFRQILSSDEIA